MSDTPGVCPASIDCLTPEGSMPTLRPYSPTHGGKAATASTATERDTMFGDRLAARNAENPPGHAAHQLHASCTRPSPHPSTIGESGGDARGSPSGVSNGSGSDSPSSSSGAVHGLQPFRPAAVTADAKGGEALSRGASCTSPFLAASPTLGKGSTTPPMSVDYAVAPLAPQGNHRHLHPPSTNNPQPFVRVGYGNHHPPLLAVTRRPSSVGSDGIHVSPSLSPGGCVSSSSDRLQSPTKLSIEAQPFYPQRYFPPPASNGHGTTPPLTRSPRHDSSSGFAVAPALTTFPQAGGQFSSLPPGGIGKSLRDGAASPATPFGVQHGGYTSRLKGTAAAYTPTCTSAGTGHPPHGLANGLLPGSSLDSNDAAANARQEGVTASKATPPVPLGEDDLLRQQPTSLPNSPAHRYQPALPQHDSGSGVPTDMLNVVTGAPIPVPERVVLVDTLDAFASFEAVCEDLLREARRRDTLPNRYAPAITVLGENVSDVEAQAIVHTHREEQRHRMSGGLTQREHGARPPDCPPLVDEEDFRLTIGLDLEGYNLGRSGRVCIITVATGDAVFVIDTVLLPDDVLSAAGGTAFSEVLQSPQIMKLMFDCRADCDALYHIYGVRLQGVCDLQVAAGLTLSGCRARYLVGMEDAFARLSLFRDNERQTKSEGRKFFDNRAGGNCERWEDRPLDPLLLRYCAVDVKHFFEAFYQLRHFAFESLCWAQVRIAHVCSGKYSSQLSLNAQNDFRCLRDAPPSPAHPLPLTWRRDPYES